MALHKMKIFNSVASKIVCTVKSSQHFSKRGFCSFYGESTEAKNVNVFMNTLSFKAEAVEIPCDEGIRAYYSSIELNPIFYNLAKVQVELFHGVLYINIPIHPLPKFYRAPSL